MAVSGKSPVDEPAILVLSLYPQTKHTRTKNIHSKGICTALVLTTLSEVSQKDKHLLISLGNVKKLSKGLDQSQ